MYRWVSPEVWDRLVTKEFIYDSQVQPILDQANLTITILTIGIIILSLACVVGWIFYFAKRKECKFYRKCLNVNFGWFKDN